MADLLKRVRQSQACMGVIGTITLPAELHHELVAEIERLRGKVKLRSEQVDQWIAEVDQWIAEVDWSWKENAELKERLEDMAYDSMGEDV